MICNVLECEILMEVVVEVIKLVISCVNYGFVGVLLFMIVVYKMIESVV